MAIVEDMHDAEHGSSSFFLLLPPIVADSQQLCFLAPEFKLLLAGHASGQ